MFKSKTSSTNNYFSIKRAKLISAASLILALCSCGNESDSIQTSNSTPINKAQPTPINTDKVDATVHVESPLTTRYLALASQQFKTICSSAEQLQTSVQLFLSAPNEKTLQETKEQWLTTHDEYTASSLFRTLNIKHPELDRSQIEPVKHSLTIRIDQSPILPGYLDAVKGYPQSGYVFSPLPIDALTLNKEHQFSDTLYVTLGFHAIEFLLWGESDETTRKSSDYLALKESKENPELAPSRRSQLLSLTTQLLSVDLHAQCLEWVKAEGYYPSQLKAMTTEEQNEYIITSLELRLPDIQIKQTQIKNAAEPHSAFAHSDEQDLQAQIKTFKSLLESKEWTSLSEQQERAKKLITLAKALY